MRKYGNKEDYLGVLILHKYYYNITNNNALVAAVSPAGGKMEF